MMQVRPVGGRRPRLKLSEVDRPILKDTGELRESIPRKRIMLALDAAAEQISKQVKELSGGRYFDRESDCSFFTSGCKLFDLALGGGWVEGRVSNVVGDKSTGKTQVAIEAMANYARLFPDPTTHILCYDEVEDAFDEGYAAVLGMPLDRVKRYKRKTETVKEFERRLEAFCNKVPDGGGGLYILDSLDALSEEDELRPKKDKEGNEKGTYGMGRAKGMSRLFRRLIRLIGRKNVHLMVVSQLRHNIGVTFGEKYTRVGGKALDFYSSHVVWLAHLGEVKKIIDGNKRTVGIDVRLKVKKNKVGIPFREIQYPILVAYGMDDVQAAIDWLDEVGRLKDAGFDSYKEAKLFMRGFRTLDKKEAKVEREKINEVLTRVWYEIEKQFLPEQGKY